MMPCSVSLRSRAVSTPRAMPRLAWKSSNRRVPRNASRRISGVHHSPTTSTVLAIEQFFSDLHEAFDRLEHDLPQAAVVLTARGESFSAGIDLKYTAWISSCLTL